MNAKNEQLHTIKKTALDVITNPIGFFQNMPVSGGFLDPLIFLVAIGIVSGIIHAVLSIIGFGFDVSFFMALSAVIYVPLLVGIFSFVSAAIFFIIWKLMGSGQSYETAYRCVAYAAAISPITALIGIIPYIGPVIGLLWMMFLIVIASEKVHKLSSQKAWIVFGIVFGLFILLNVNSQYAARNVEKEVQKFNHQMKNMEDMTPEEAGRAMGEFFKGLDEGSRK